MGYSKFSAALGINFTQGNGNIPGGFTPWTLDRSTGLIRQIRLNTELTSLFENIAPEVLYHDIS